LSSYSLFFLLRFAAYFSGFFFLECSEGAAADMAAVEAGAGADSAVEAVVEVLADLVGAACPVAVALAAAGSEDTNGSGEDN